MPGKLGPGTAIQYNQRRGMEIGQHWLGVLSDGEAARLQAMQASATRAIERAELAAHLASMTAQGGLPAFANVRNRLWQARLDPVSATPPGWPRDAPNNWGTRTVYSKLAPLPQGPEFLNRGLLTPNGDDRQPLWLREPDSSRRGNTTPPTI